MRKKPGTSKAVALRQAGLALNLTVFMASIVTLAAVANFFSQRPQFRAMLDATKTRAYALSPQTQQLLEEIDDSGDNWTIAVILVEANTGRAVKRQVNEVLRRFTDASTHITAIHIDPTDADTLDEYESLLAHLRLIYSDKIEAYNAALAPGIKAVDDFELFVEQRSGQLADLRRNLSEGDAIFDDFEQLMGGFSLRSQQIASIRQQLANSLREDEARPISDFETARSILVGALTLWADELMGIEQLFARWRAYPNIDPSIREFVNSSKGQYERLAMKLVKIADPIKFLPELEIGTIGGQIERGEAAIVIGPEGAALIPSGQIFPQVQQQSQAGVTFDRRFRGEQMIASSMRSLLVNPMPLVVFVHAEPQTLLVRRKLNIDLVGPASILKASRFDVKEWMVTQSDPPTPKAGQSVVWIVVPPPIPLRTSFTPGDDEIALIDSVKQLIDDGEMVMLNLAPSGMQKFNQRDPWQAVALAMGVEVDTSKVIFEQQIDQSGKAINLRTARITEFESESPVSVAAHGLVTSLDLPLAITKATAGGPIGVELNKIAVIKPKDNRWLEDDWAIDPTTIDKPNENQFFTKDLTVIATMQRSNPLTRNMQRFVVIGSSGWLLSNRSDIVNDMGGGRVALMYPGNYELLLASVAWLSGHNEMIAPSAISQQIQTLSGISQSVKTRWRWITVVILPCAILILGSLVWLVRQRS